MKSKLPQLKEGDVISYFNNGVRETAIVIRAFYQCGDNQKVCLFISDDNIDYFRENPEYIVNTADLIDLKIKTKQ